MTPDEDRAVRAGGVFRTQPCFVLATFDPEGPWAAMIAFLPAHPCALYFHSRKWTRHSTAIAQEPRVAGVIYAPPDHSGLGETVQFDGVAVAVPMNSVEGRDVWGQLGLRTEAGLAPGPSGDQQIYRLNVTSAFVLDKAAWAAHGVDVRLAVPVDKMFEVVLSDRQPPFRCT